MNKTDRIAQTQNPWERLGVRQRQALSAIACTTMQLETVETRNSDRLDFHDVAVWEVRRALALAFLEGRRRNGGGLKR
jgi:hypothetical protein